VIGTIDLVGAIGSAMVGGGAGALLAILLFARR
jgi:hypothetical protein